jgi:hypothetical protein
VAIEYGTKPRNHTADQQPAAADAAADPDDIPV